jgi:hypothetical protein
LNGDKFHLHTFITLKKIERAEDLRGCIGCSGFRPSGGAHGRSGAVVRSTRGINKDYGDIWRSVPATQRVEALRTMFEHVELLGTSGIVVAARIDRMRLRMTNPEASKEPFTMNVLRDVALAAANPVLVAVREKNAPIQCA